MTIKHKYAAETRSNGLPAMTPENLHILRQSVKDFSDDVRAKSGHGKLLMRDLDLKLTELDILSTFIEESQAKITDTSRPIKDSDVIILESFLKGKVDPSTEMVLSMENFRGQTDAVRRSRFSFAVEGLGEVFDKVVSKIVEYVRTAIEWIAELYKDNFTKLGSLETSIAGLEVSIRKNGIRNEGGRVEAKGRLKTNFNYMAKDVVARDVIKTGATLNSVYKTVENALKEITKLIEDQVNISTPEELNAKLNDPDFLNFDVKQFASLGNEDHAIPPGLYPVITVQYNGSGDNKKTRNIIMKLEKVDALDNDYSFIVGSPSELIKISQELSKVISSLRTISKESRNRGNVISRSMTKIERNLNAVAKRAKDKRAMKEIKQLTSGLSSVTRFYLSVNSAYVKYATGMLRAGYDYMDLCYSSKPESKSK